MKFGYVHRYQGLCNIYFQSKYPWNKNDHKPWCIPESLVQNSMNINSVEESEGLSVY